ncbi:MAG: hypothetical protein V3V08_23445 [Nannocystaceae bacterium]
MSSNAWTRGHAAGYRSAEFNFGERIADLKRQLAEAQLNKQALDKLFDVAESTTKGRAPDLLTLGQRYDTLKTENEALRRNTSTLLNTFRHTHEAKYEDDELLEHCGRCGLSIRHSIHICPPREAKASDSAGEEEG